MSVRINRYLASCGLGSRRGCEEFIRGGRVEMNREICVDPAAEVSDEDDVRFDGVRVQPEQLLTLLLNKPKGYLSTRDDPQSRQTIYELIPPKYATLRHVGRLDKDSEGLILLSNDGDLALQLTHPSKGVEKEYIVSVNHAFTDSHIPVLERGLETEEGFAKAERVERISVRRMRVILKQGLKRQIRLMFGELGYEVNRLVRVRIGDLTLDTVPDAGGWKLLNKEEISRLQKPSTHKTERPKPSNIGSSETAARPTPFRGEGEKRNFGFDNKPRFDHRGGDKPPFQRREGSGFGGDSRPPHRTAFNRDDRRGSDRPPFQRREGSGFGGDSRPPHRPSLNRDDHRGSDRPPFQRREGSGFGGDSRPPHRPSFNRDDQRGGDRHPFQRREGSGFGGDSRPPHRPSFNRDDHRGNDRPPFHRREGSSFGGDSRPPQRPSFDRDDHRGSDRPPFQRREGSGFGGDSRPPHRPSFNRDEHRGSDRPPFQRREGSGFGGDSRPPQRPSFDRDDRRGNDRPPFQRREGSGSGGDTRPPHRPSSGKDDSKGANPFERFIPRKFRPEEDTSPPPRTSRRGEGRASRPGSSLGYGPDRNDDHKHKGGGFQGKPRGKGKPPRR